MPRIVHGGDVGEILSEEFSFRNIVTAEVPSGAALLSAVFFFRQRRNEK